MHALHPQGLSILERLESMLLTEVSLDSVSYRQQYIFPWQHCLPKRIEL